MYDIFHLASKTDLNSNSNVLFYVVAIIIATIILIVFLLVKAKNHFIDKPRNHYQELENKLINNKKELEENYQKKIDEINALLDITEKANKIYMQNNVNIDDSFYNEVISNLNESVTKLSIKTKQFAYIDCSKEISEINTNINRVRIIYEHLISFYSLSRSNLIAIPYMSRLMSDFETYGLAILADRLDWGTSYERLKKVKSIRDIRKDAQLIVEKNKDAQYQLAYLLELFPNLQDVIDCDFNQLPVISIDELSEYDSTRDYLSKEEYNKLSSTERNQLALDRYKESHRKTKWQIGRDYELYIGYRYTNKGYDVNYFGSYKGLEDLGRDLICKKGNTTLIVQCKYWSSSKQIHEKHINQLFGTMTCYCIENNCNKDDVKGIIVTNISLSETAKRMADYLGIEYVENLPLRDYPCIKCNVGRDEYGCTTKIYHLPFDRQYDIVKMEKAGTFFATTVKEAEDAGFRRTYKWFGNN